MNSRNRYEQAKIDIINMLRYDVECEHTIKSISLQRGINEDVLRGFEKDIVDIMYYMKGLDIEKLSELNSEIWEHQKTILMLKNEIYRLKKEV